MKYSVRSILGAALWDAAFVQANSGRAACSMSSLDFAAKLTTTFGPSLKLKDGDPVLAFANDICGSITLLDAEARERLTGSV